MLWQMPWRPRRVLVQALVLGLEVMVRHLGEVYTLETQHELTRCVPPHSLPTCAAVALPLTPTTSTSPTTTGRLVSSVRADTG